MKMQSNSLKSTLAIAACAAIGAATYAAVIIDDEGRGFVGKGDIQNAFGWDNATLQENADSVLFRFVDQETIEWQCVKTVTTGGPNPEIKIITQVKESIQGINAAIAYDARKNKKGQITGFVLEGFEDDAVELDADDLGKCPESFELVAGSLGAVDSEDSAGGVIEISIDGNDWIAFDLPVDQGE
jgi:hypothetical protein